jgi:deoxyribonuclease V
LVLHLRFKYHHGRRATGGEPGLLAFREGPAILAGWEKLPLKPDLLMFDGQGIAHPRGLGITSQMGLWLRMPTIGVAKSRLYGRHTEVGPRFGDQSELQDEQNPGCIIGAVVRTREKSKPLFISAGYLIDLENAVTFVRACCHGYRLPEPSRWAHKISIGGDLLRSARSPSGFNPLIENWVINC